MQMLFVALLLKDKLVKGLLQVQNGDASQESLIGECGL